MKDDECPRCVGFAVIKRVSEKYGIAIKDRPPHGLRFPRRITLSYAVGDGIALPSYGDPRYDDPVDLTAITRDIARGA